MSQPKTPEPRWDWIATVLVVLAIALQAVLTFEFWAPHFGVHR